MELATGPSDLEGLTIQITDPVGTMNGRIFKLEDGELVIELDADYLAEGQS